MINQLKFNFYTILEPNIIKGLGIPYMGSKRAIADELIKRMLEIKPDAEYFYDLFGGGGAMSLIALQYGLKVHYNELSTQICELLRFLKDNKKIPDKWFKFVDRETFIRNKDLPTVYGGFISSCYSFGNNGKDYLFNKKIEKIKHLAHDVVVFKDFDSLEKLNNILKIDIKMPYYEKIHARRLELCRQVREQKKERLRLQQLQQLDISSCSYENVLINTPIKKTIVYLDPPYRNTGGYKSGKFDFNKLDKWFKNNHYTCFMSEYDAPHDCVFEIRKRVTLTSINNSLKKIEKLYWNGK